MYIPDEEDGYEGQQEDEEGDFAMNLDEEDEGEEMTEAEMDVAEMRITLDYMIEKGWKEELIEGTRKELAEKEKKLLIQPIKAKIGVN